MYLKGVFIRGGGVSIQGSLHRGGGGGGSACESLYPVGSASREGVCNQRGLHPGGVCFGGSASVRVCIWEPVSKAVHGGGAASREGSASRGTCIQGTCIQGRSASRGDLHPGGFGRTPVFMWPVMHAQNPPPPPQLDRITDACWKYYLAPSFVCGR